MPGSRGILDFLFSSGLIEGEIFDFLTEFFVRLVLSWRCFIRLVSEAHRPSWYFSVDDGGW